MIVRLVYGISRGDLLAIELLSSTKMRNISAIVRENTTIFYGHSKYSLELSILNDSYGKQ